AINLTPLIGFLPEFIISAIISGFLFQAITNDKTFVRPIIGGKKPEQKSILKKVSSRRKPVDMKEYERMKNKTRYQALLFNSNMHIISSSALTVSAWILLIYAMIGIGKSSIFMPTFGFKINFIVYALLVIIFSVAMISSFSQVVRLREIYRIIASVFAVLSVVIFFEIPAMKWLFYIFPKVIVSYIFIYFAGLFILFLCYSLWWKLAPKITFYVSFYSSILTYFAIVSLMIYNSIPKL
ncbi:MAG: hypothetical protein OWQ34_01045, partial [Thermoplasma acidophilum]|nr:hypothetical protein [Thermoplasma acidophilum]